MSGVKRAVLAAAAVGAMVGPAAVVWAAAGIGLAARAWAWRRWRRVVLSLVPVMLFAGTLGALEWMGRGEVSVLGVRTVAVFLLSTAAWGGVSGAGLALGYPARSAGQRAVLFGLMVGHFAWILGAEARRALAAHRLAAPRRRGPWWFGSLGRAMGGMFVRAFMRAERFYAAQWVRGVGE